MNAHTAQFETHWYDALDLAQAHTGVFVALWSGLFFLMLGTLISVGLAPQALLDDDTTDVALAAAIEIPADIPETLLSTASTTESQPAAVRDGSDAPVHIIIDAIGVDTAINNPTQTDMDVLNSSLETGAVHYPGSGNLEDISNMFLFGHSSHLPIVNNPAYKAFNDLEDLEKGDLIRVQSQTKEYHYRVTKVALVDADDALVHLSTKEKKLTLSTCNNFGSKQDRYVVDAEFIGHFAL